MKIAILSPSGETYFNRRILEEAAIKKMECVIYNPSEFLLGSRNIFHRGILVSEIDVCILRTPPYREDKDYFHLAARMMESKDIPVINPPEAVEITGNKIRTKIALEARGIPLLKSLAVRKRENLDFAAKYVGGYPLFLKTIFGTRGIGVIFCPCRETLHAAAQTMWAYYANVFVEEYAEKSKGKTVRVLVCGDEVLGAVANSPGYKPPQDGKNGYSPEKTLNIPIEKELSQNYSLIRSNFSRGGEVGEFPLNDQMKTMAVNACKAIGIRLGGVDLIETKRGWNVLEINSSPGIKGFEAACGSNTASGILEYAASLCKK